MKKISRELRQAIQYYLSDTIDIDRVDRRKEWANNSEFPTKLIQLVDWDKKPVDLFASHLIDRCLSWSTYTPDDDRHPLIEYIKSTESFGGSEHILKMLEITDGLRTELFTNKIQPPVKDVLSPTANDEFLEKLIGEPTLIPISFLEQGLQLSRSVALVDAGSTIGTSFLISPDLLLTNHHVIADIEAVQHTVFRFNYQHNVRNSIGPIEDYRKKEGGIFYTNNDLDYTIIELENTPGNKWGFIKVDPKSTISRDQRVNIIQHPGGRPKQISFRNNYVEYVDQKVLQYVTHTELGSSGSPVFNDAWELVGLHHAGGTIREPLTQRQVFRNEGIRLNAILGSLPREIREKIS